MKPNSSDTKAENPLNEQLREAERLGMKIILMEFISAADRVGATTISVEVLRKKAKDLINEK